ncbi:MAG TPA: [protein-PII] uridylyltransferase, partial [Pseudomonadales bacterium]
LGAKDAIAFAQQHGLSTSETRLLAWLVENHLIMSVTAQRQDISDPDVIQKFAERMGDELHLDYLYVLTIADICATNPELWNGWRATLMRQLYSATKRALRRGLGNPIDKTERIAETRQEALYKLSKLPKKNYSALALPILEHLGDDYFLRNNANDIAWHTQAIIEHGNKATPLVLIQETNELKYEGGTKIFIYTQDKHNLFAATVAVLDTLHLNIVDARIMTSQTNFSLDTYIVLEEDGSPIGNNPGRIQKIRESLVTALADESNYPEIVNRRIPRQLKHFDIKTNVVIRDSENHPYTILELNTLDRPGFLAKFGAILMCHKVELINAKIATLGERIEDVFFLVDENQQAFGNTPLSKQLEKDLLEQLDTLDP